MSRIIERTGCYWMAAAGVAADFQTAVADNRRVESDTEPYIVEELKTQD